MQILSGTVPPHHRTTIYDRTSCLHTATFPYTSVHVSASLSARRASGRRQDGLLGRRICSYGVARSHGALVDRGDPRKSIVHRNALSRRSHALRDSNLLRLPDRKTSERQDARERSSVNPPQIKEIEPKAEVNSLFLISESKELIRQKRTFFSRSRQLFSPAGLIATGCQDKLIRLFDPTSSGKECP